MKKIMIVLLCLCMLINCCAFAGAESMNLAGGWGMTEDIAVTEDARAAFDKAMEEFVGVGYEPVALLGTQVVAGLNYCLLCRASTVTLPPQSFYALVYIYAGVDGTCAVMDIQEINMGINYVYEDMDSQNPAMNICGSYLDKMSERAMMFITPVGNNGADIQISWSNSAVETVVWYLSGTVNDTADCVTYKDGVMTIFTWDENDEPTVNEVYTDGQGTLTVQKDGTILWQDLKEDAGRDCVFVFETDYDTDME